MPSLPLRFAFRYLLSRKSHNVINLISGISVAGMAVGTAALVLILSVYNGFNDVVSRSFDDADPDLCIRPAEGKLFVPDSLLFSRIYEREEIASMSSVLEEQAFLSYGDEQALARVKGVDEVFEEESPLQNHLMEGQFLLHLGYRPCAVVGASLARNLQLSPRFVTPLEIYYPDRKRPLSTLNPMQSLRSVKTRPCGIVTVNANTDASLVLVPLETMQELLDCGPAVSGVEIRLSEGLTPQDAAAFQKELEGMLGPELRLLDRYHQNESVYKMMRYEKLAIFLILIFVVIIISFNIFSSLTMLIIEKRPDIQTLYSMGAPEGTVRKIFVLEGTLVTLLGLGIGLVVGISLTLVQQHFGLIKMPGNFSFTAYPVILQAGDLIWTAVGVDLVGFLIALIPARTLHETR